MMWYLLDASDSSLCIVFEKNILQAGHNNLDIDQEVTFFYQGKKYSGTILAKNGDRNVLDADMNRRLKECKSRKSQLDHPEPVSGKRRISAPNFYGNKTNEHVKKKKGEAPKMSEEEKRRQKILERNKQEAEKNANLAILAKASKTLVKAKNDPDWAPDHDDHSMDSEIYDSVTQDKELNLKKSNIVRQLLNSSSEEDEEEGQSVSRSPSKADLKKQLALLQKQLQEQTGKCQDKERVSEKEKKTTETPTMKAQVKKKDNRNVNEEGEQGDSNENIEDCIEDSSFNDNSHSEGDKVLKSDHGKDDGGLNVDKFFDHLADNICEHEHLEYQLYGKANDTQELANGIYCKSSDLTKALTSSSNVQHLMRRLMVGVFNTSEIVNCTVTGQSWHAGGEASKNEKKDALHPKALKTIIDFSNAIAKRKKWSRIKPEAARPVFAVKLTEIRKKLKK